MEKVVFASTNANKIDIFVGAFLKLGLDKQFELLTLKDFPDLKNVVVEEPGNSFEDDALIKAKTYSKLTNHAVISQDRGFIFRALNWPGTKSKLVLDGDEKLPITYRTKDDMPLETKEKHRINSEFALSRLTSEIDRSMDIIQATAVCLPNGDCFVDLHICEGSASYQINDTNATSMTSFFIPKGYNTPMGGWSETEIFDFDITLRYPINSNVISFLDENLL